MITKQNIREVSQRVTGIKTTDGDGVQLTRIIGSAELSMIDPFLLLDEFKSDQSQSHLGGFPEHPHRGFETVSYLLAGRMHHKDNAGHEGVIDAGGVQWMSAGKGIVHSEMPEQENGLLHGFQLWVNLPAAEKMSEPAYQEFSSEKIAFEQHENGTEIRVIAGQTDNGSIGPVINRHVTPLYLDVFLPVGAVFEQIVEDNNNAFIYVVDGELSIGKQEDIVDMQKLVIMGEGNTIRVKANQDARFLLIAARPLNEPVARGGPFVMNTKEEIAQAFNDFRR